MDKISNIRPVASPTDRVMVFVMQPYTPEGENQLWRLNCCAYISEISDIHRSNLVNNLIDIPALKLLYPLLVPEIDSNNPNGNAPIWSRVATPTVAEFYIANHVLKPEQWERVAAWIAVRASTWIKCEYEGENGDTLNYETADDDSFRAIGLTPPYDITGLGMPWLAERAGYLPWQRGGWEPGE